jgi:hypothetical protein
VGLRPQECRGAFVSVGVRDKNTANCKSIFNSLDQVNPFGKGF